MSDFNSLLTRAFAEAPEPADDVFVVKVSAVVAKRERMSKAITAAQICGWTIGAVAAAYGVWSIALMFAPQMMASFGLEIARAHGALSEAPIVASQASSVGASWLNSLGAGLTQILLVTGALVGGAVAYRSARD